MVKRWLRRITPDKEAIRRHKHLRIFGNLLHDGNLWHLNRRSAAGGFAVGLFVMYLPIPFQMVVSATVAILVRVNLPLSVALVWITNPITMPPLFYLAYRVGAWTLGQPPGHEAFHFTAEWLTNSLQEIWAPLLLGSVLCGTFCAAVGYATIQFLWRWHLIRQIRIRRARYQTAPAVRTPSSKRQT